MSAKGNCIYVATTLHEFKKYLVEPANIESEIRKAAKRNKNSKKIVCGIVVDLDFNLRINFPTVWQIVLSKIVSRQKRRLIRSRTLPL